MITVDKKQRQSNRVSVKAGRPSKVNDCTKDQIVVKYNAVRPVTEIAKSFGISRNTVYRVVKERSTDV